MLKRFFALIMVMALLLPQTGLAASKKSKSKATETPAPVKISAVQQEPPQQIQDVLDIAYREWQSLNGKRIKNCNKFTEWRGKGISFGWCGGYITWCMLEAGVKQEVLEKTEEKEVEGVVHVKEASVGKLLRGYQRMNRSTDIPQKGFLVVYGAVSYNKTIHIGLVYDVEDLGDGKYRLTTLEGNMGSKIRMFVHDYDSKAADQLKNLTPPPASAQTNAETDAFSYQVAKDDHKKSYWINCFLMPWIPDDHPVTVTAEEENAPMITPAPVETPAPIEIEETELLDEEWEEAAEDFAEVVATDSEDGEETRNGQTAGVPETEESDVDFLLLMDEVDIKNLPTFAKPNR